MDLQALKSLRLAPIEHRYGWKDSALYALGLGYGDRPQDPTQLQFLYEHGQRAAPSICNVLAHPGFWVNRPELGLDWIKILHGEQAFRLHRPMEPEGFVRGEYEVLAVEDKGPEKGAVMHVAKQLYDIATGGHLATVTSVYMLRGDGGQGGFGAPPAAPDAIADATPSAVVDVAILPQAALIYRLSGDFNPIHADPATAAKAGFTRPILHGLCTMGLATRAVIEAAGEGDPTRLTALSMRFSKPVYPGETIRVELFGDTGDIRFRARALERDVMVLDRGSATLAKH